MFQAFVTEVITSLAENNLPRAMRMLEHCWKYAWRTEDRVICHDLGNLIQRDIVESYLVEMDNSNRKVG